MLVGFKKEDKEAPVYLPHEEPRHKVFGHLWFDQSLGGAPAAACAAYRIRTTLSLRRDGAWGQGFVRDSNGTRRLEAMATRSEAIKAQVLVQLDDRVRTIEQV